MADQTTRSAYWRRNLRYLAILLVIWFAVSYGCGILFVEELNRVPFGGFKLGFWFAQQGAIYTFVILIFVYVWLMNRLEREFFAAGPENRTGEGAGKGAGEAVDEDAGS